MRINIKGLINRLDDLRERLNKLFEKLEKLDDLDQEEMAIEDVEQYFQNDDAFNLSITLVVLEQADKVDRALEIIKEKPIIALVDYKYTYEEWLELVDEKDKDLFKNEEEYNLLKEVLL